MRDAIFEYLKREGNASFVAMDRDIPGFRGVLELSFGPCPELIVWPWISEEASEAITALIRENLIWPETAGWLVHCFERGEIPDLPVTVERVAVSEPHWLPVVLHFGPKA
jgi:hypothetical protein